MLGRKFKWKLTGLELTHVNNSASSVLMCSPSLLLLLFQSRNVMLSKQILKHLLLQPCLMPVWLLTPEKASQHTWGAGTCSLPCFSSMNFLQSYTAFRLAMPSAFSSKCFWPGQATFPTFWLNDFPMLMLVWCSFPEFTATTSFLKTIMKKECGIRKLYFTLSHFSIREVDWGSSIYLHSSWDNK